MPASLQAVAYVLPLTYSVDALRQAMTGAVVAQMFLIDLAVQIFYTIVFLVATVWVLKKTIE